VIFGGKIAQNNQDREQKRVRGFGFVEMVNWKWSQRAIPVHERRKLLWAQITVNVAEDKGPGFNGGGKGGFRRN